MTERRIDVPVDLLRATLVVVLLVGLLVVGGLQVQRLATATSDVDRGRDAVAAAERQVLALVRVDAASSDADIARIGAGTTSDFKSQFRSQATAFRAALKANKVVSTGSVDSAGLTALSGRSATVLVASSGTVKNARSEKPQPRSYRFKVSLREVDGSWLVSGMEFVS
ncbi:MAG: hypothetical protein PGN07_12430 [Aeromicrobium erythreum]